MKRRRSRQAARLRRSSPTSRPRSPRPSIRVLAGSPWNSKALNSRGRAHWWESRAVVRRGREGLDPIFDLCLYLRIGGERCAIDRNDAFQHYRIRSGRCFRSGAWTVGRLADLDRRRNNERVRGGASLEQRDSHAQHQDHPLCSRFHGSFLGFQTGPPPTRAASIASLSSPTIRH